MARRPSAWFDAERGIYVDRAGKPIAADDLDNYFLKQDQPPAQGAEPARVEKGARKSQYGDIHAGVRALNGVVANFPPLTDDALVPEEEELLAKAIDSAQQRSERFRKYVKSANEKSGVLFLIGVCLSLALPRLSRHGLIPGFAIPAGQQPQGPGTPNPAPEPVMNGIVAGDIGHDSRYPVG